MKTWKQRLEMKAEDFKAAKPIGMSEVGCIQAAGINNAHLAGLAEVLEGVEANAPGCTDSGCPFTRHLGGMRTNGGCRCLMDKNRIVAFQEFLAALRALRERDGK